MSTDTNMPSSSQPAPEPKLTSTLEEPLHRFQHLLSDLTFAPARSVFAFLGVAEVSPAVQLTAQDGGYELCIELPGVDPRDIQAEIAHGVLTLSGEKYEGNGEDERRRLMNERRFGPFRRHVTLPPDIDPKSVKGDFQNGILTIRMKKDRNIDEPTRITFA